jgi:hypothetical protein
MIHSCPHTGTPRSTEEIAVTTLATIAEHQAALIAELTLPESKEDKGSNALDVFLGIAIQALTTLATRGDGKSFHHYTVGVGGRRERLVRAQLAAEEARIEREAAAARAKLVADFAPKLLDAQIADEEEIAARFAEEEEEEAAEDADSP